ncbi:MAG: thiolase family protein [Firmicutes bacterium]|nr:thiolase family protein [Bacillota bacterium]
MSRDIVIVSACRTPFDKFGGITRSIPSYEIASQIMIDCLDRINFKKEDVPFISYGTTVHAEVGPYVNVPVRQALLMAGFPVTTKSVTVDRACCSSMTGLMIACREIQVGEVDVALCVGAENLSNIPYSIDSKVRWGLKLGSAKLFDVGAGFVYPGRDPVSCDAENVAREYGIGRRDMDEWSARSHQTYKKAFDEGKFKDEVVPYTVHDKKKGDIVLEADLSPRPETTVEILSKLKPVYGTEGITAGNAPGMNAGAAAILLMTEDKAKEYGLEILGYIRDFDCVCSEPQNITTVPALVTESLLKRNDMDIADLKIWEVNEAFAAMPLVSSKVLAKGDEALTQHLRDICNVNGGAVAIGHPMGASGLRIIMAAMYELRRRGGGRGVACICGGLAQGDGVLIEVK